MITEQVASEEKTLTPELESARAHVKYWQEKVVKAKEKWGPDFNRMRRNMDFVAGLQWASQKGIDEEKYIANFVLRLVEHKVSTLYAKNPTFVAQRRKRLDFALWDGSSESIEEALNAQMLAMSMGVPVPMEAQALIADYDEGKRYQRLYDRLANTLNVVFQQQIDSQEPEFKTQAKSMVRKTITCGVGYIRVNFCRDYLATQLSQSQTKSTTVERARSMMQKANLLAKNEVEADGKEAEEIDVLAKSLQAEPPEMLTTKEHLEFDFPPSTSIIVDQQCRSLVGFVGARWIVEEYVLPREFVNSFFEVDVKAGGDTKTFSMTGEEMETGEEGQACVRLWEVFDLDTRSTFILCDGYKDYIVAPEPVEPSSKSFWPIFALVFNNVETENGCKAPVYPPSDVQLAMPSQKEYNRAREEWRSQRKANRVKYATRKGLLTEGTKDALLNAEGSEVLELDVPPDVEPSKILQPIQHAPIDPALYDVGPLLDDTLRTTGAQESNLGPAQPNVTATVGSIAEQSRMTVAGSNVDALDDLLSAVANCAGEKLIRGMSKETALEIAGRGGAWPELERENILREISLQVVAASSGRPNKALEMQNIRELAPLLLQAGANPKTVIREIVRRLDDRMEVEDFYSANAMPLPAGPAPAQAPMQAVNPQNT